MARIVLSLPSPLVRLTPHETLTTSPAAPGTFAPLVAIKMLRDARRMSAGLDMIEAALLADEAGTENVFAPSQTAAVLPKASTTSSATTATTTMGSNNTPGSVLNASSSSPSSAAATPVPRGPADRLVSHTDFLLGLSHALKSHTRSTSTQAMRVTRMLLEQCTGVSEAEHAARVLAAGLLQAICMMLERADDAEDNSAQARTSGYIDAVAALHSATFLAGGHLALVGFVPATLALATHMICTRFPAAQIVSVLALVNLLLSDDEVRDVAENDPDQLRVSLAQLQQFRSWLQHTLVQGATSNGKESSAPKVFGCRNAAAAAIRACVRVLDVWGRGLPEEDEEDDSQDCSQEVEAAHMDTETTDNLAANSIPAVDSESPESESTSASTSRNQSNISADVTADTVASDSDAEGQGDAAAASTVHGSVVVPVCDSQYSFHSTADRHDEDNGLLDELELVTPRSCPIHTPTIIDAAAAAAAASAAVAAAASVTAAIAASIEAVCEVNTGMSTTTPLEAINAAVKAQHVLNSSRANASLHTLPLPLFVGGASASVFTFGSNISTLEEEQAAEDSKLHFPAALSSVDAARVMATFAAAAAASSWEAGASMQRGSKRVMSELWSLSEDVEDEESAIEGCASGYGHGSSTLCGSAVGTGLSTRTPSHAPSSFSSLSSYSSSNTSSTGCQGIRHHLSTMFLARPESGKGGAGGHKHTITSCSSTDSYAPLPSTTPLSSSLPADILASFSAASSKTAPSAFSQSDMLCPSYPMASNGTTVGRSHILHTSVKRRHSSELVRPSHAVKVRREDQACTGGAL